jgi:LuxR family transcriptional regulator, maltose regulon positive regulatory protein
VNSGVRPWSDHSADGPSIPTVKGIVTRDELFARLKETGRVAVVSAPAGSGKTLLLRSWIAAAGLTRSTAWVSVAGRERDPQRFWLAVAAALRGTAAGSALMGELSAAPDLNGWAIAERLLKDLAALADPIWLVIDDVHELASGEVLAQLELLVMRAPPHLRFVLATRADVRLGLHRLRLEGELTEIRPADLRFTLDEAQELLAAAGVDLPTPAIKLLHARTEGWAAGLRLAALSLAGNPDPHRFAAEFGGSERTVAEYLVAEVLERQPAPARRLLLRTSVLERVNGELADLLSGDHGGERILQDLEEANAFVLALDARRSWFRYHHLFADLLQLELRRTAPGEIAALHATAADWFTQHGFAVEAIRHIQAARDWARAARLLADHWVSLVLDGQAATAHELLNAFPADTSAGGAELDALAAADELEQGSLQEAGRYLAAAAHGLASVPAGRRQRLQILLTILRLLHARRSGDLPAAVAEAQLLLEPANGQGAAQPGGDGDLHALALINLGMAELWTAQFDQAGHHLEQGTILACQIGRPYLEVRGLAHSALVSAFGPLTLVVERTEQAIELARRHGWGEEPIIGAAYAALGAAKLTQARLAEAELWITHAERTIPAEITPAGEIGLYYTRGLLEMARGRPGHALTAFRAGARLARLLITPHRLETGMQACLLLALVETGQTDAATRGLAKLEQHERDAAEMRITLAVLRLSQHNPRAAAAALAPILSGSAPRAADADMVEIQAFLLEATARDALGDPDAAGRALERALDLAEPEGILLPFLLHLAPGLLRRHARHQTAHADLTSQVLDLITGTASEEPAPRPAHLSEQLSDSEARILRYLPTNLTAPEIAEQLHLRCPEPSGQSVQ